MAKLADRDTLRAIGKQIDSGKFVPDEFEFSFMMDEQEIVLDSGHAKMCITGKIDEN